MRLNESKKIITSHLEGITLGNIGDEMDISKYTVGAVIEKWNSGNVLFFQ